MTVARLVLVVVMLFASSGAAEARDSRAQARAHFERGTRAFQLAKFDRAIAEFKLAYDLSHAPGLLFNIAQAYRAQGEARVALEFYRAFVEEDRKSPLRGYASARIRELERRLGAAAHPRVPAPVPPAHADPPPVPTRSRPGRRLQIAGLISGVSGVVLLGAAWATVEADGEPAERRAWILGGTGGAALIAGGILYFIGRDRESSRPRLTLAPQRAGVRMGVRWAF